MSQGLSYRGSYALIGVKDGAALAEQVASYRNGRLVEQLLSDTDLRAGLCGRWPHRCCDRTLQFIGKHVLGQRKPIDQKCSQ